MQYPPYHSGDFLPWLQRYVAEHQIRAIVPSEAFLLAIAPVYEQYQALLPDAPDAVTLYRCFAKADVEALFASHPDTALRQQLPRAAVAYRGEPLPEAALFAERLAALQG